MPLAAGLTLRQFAGVLAHEFGHFAQGAGMRLSYLIRSVNAWFARVVHERDSWDEWLWQWAHSGDWRVKLIFQTARGAVWLTRRILWVLMMTGHGISSFMLRQMEYDADTFEARLAGSATFGETAGRLRELSIANHVAVNGLQEGFRARRVPDDFPSYVVGRTSDVPEDVMNEVLRDAGTAKTGWFDSHPCDRDRVRAAEALAQSGVFGINASASAVFRDFPGLCKAVTSHHYAQVLEIPMENVRLVDTASSAAEFHERAEAAKLLTDRVGSGVLVYVLPFNPTPAPEWPSAEERTAAIEEARDLIKANRDAAANAVQEFLKLDDKMDATVVAEWLLASSFQFKASDFGLSQANAVGVQKMREQLRADMEPLAAQVRSFHDAARVVLRAGLEANAGPENAPRVELLLRVLGILARSCAPVHQAWAKARAMLLLGQNMGNHQTPQTVRESLLTLSRQISVLLAPVRQELQEAAFPYEHAKGTVTLHDYALPSGETGSNEFEIAYNLSQSLADHLTSLYSRLLGELFTLAGPVGEE